MSERSEHRGPSDRIQAIEEGNVVRLVVSAPLLTPGLGLVAAAAIAFGLVTLIGMGALAGGRGLEGSETLSETIGVLMAPMFVLAAFGAVTTGLLAIVLHALFGKMEISLDDEELVVRWGLFGRSVAKRMPVSDIRRIKEGPVGRYNRDPILGVVVVPKVVPVIRPASGWTFDFGSGLKDEDRAWVVQKLCSAFEELGAPTQDEGAQAGRPGPSGPGEGSLPVPETAASISPGSRPAFSASGRAGPNASGSSVAPQGCERRREGDATVIRAKSTWRSVGFFVILLGTVLWNGLLGFWLYGLFFGDGQWVHDDGPPTWAIIVIVLFVLAGLGMLARLLSYPRSEERVRIEGGTGEVYQGSPGSDEKQVFTVASVRSVEIEGATPDAEDGTIVIYADNRVELGMTLSKESRRWMATELRKLLLHPES